MKIKKESRLGIRFLLKFPNVNRNQREVLSGRKYIVRVDGNVVLMIDKDTPIDELNQFITVKQYSIISIERIFVSFGKEKWDSTYSWRVGGDPFAVLEAKSYDIGPQLTYQEAKDKRKYRRKEVLLDFSDNNSFEVLDCLDFRRAKSYIRG